MRRTWRNVLFSAWDVLHIRADGFWSTLVSRLSLRFQGCVYGRGFSTTGKCCFKARREGSIVLGEGVRLLAGWRSNRVGLTGPVILHTMDGGRIEIGDHSGASGAVLSARSLIRIGNRVNIGGNARIFDHDFHALSAGERQCERDASGGRTAPVFIGDDVFIGAHAIILKGVRLGNRVVVGAGAVVTRSFDDDAVIGGNPARLLHGKAPGEAGSRAASAGETG